MNIDLPANTGQTAPDQNGAAPAQSSTAQDRQSQDPNPQMLSLQVPQKSPPSNSQLHSAFSKVAKDLFESIAVLNKSIKSIDIK